MLTCGSMEMWGQVGMTASRSVAFEAIDTCVVWLAALR
jgi:hypothetical protein